VPKVPQDDKPLSKVRLIQLFSTYWLFIHVNSSSPTSEAFIEISQYFREFQGPIEKVKGNFVSKR
jgi:hypothetical protein